MLKKFLPYARQTIGQDDIDAVVRVLKGDWLTQGPLVDQFEKGLCRVTGAKYAVAVSHGTAALHLACLAAGLQKGDQAITTPLTFLATSNAVCMTGAEPVFCDINPDTWNIDPDQIQLKITSKTKAILPVHFSGLPAELLKIQQIARKNKCMVIEDAAHALGASYTVHGKFFKIGSCQHSDMAVFSFHPAKNITTGEGGVITTNKKKLYEKLKMLRTHGVVKTKEIAQKHGPWFYEMRELGWNYRITDIQCALGLSQLKKLKSFVQERRTLVRLYQKELKNISGVRFLSEPKGFSSAWHLFVVLIDFKQFKTTRKKLMQALLKKNIGTQVHYIPVHKQPFYQKNLNTKSLQFPCAENYYTQALSLPLFPKMSDSDVRYVVKHLLSILSS